MSEDVPSKICGIWADAKQGVVHLSLAGDDGSRREETAPLKPFVWSEGTPGAIEGVAWTPEKLQGQGPLQSLLHFDAQLDYAEFLKQRDKSLAIEHIRPIEHQWLLQRQGRFFQNMRFDEIRRCQLDIETYSSQEGRFSDANNPADRILAIGLRCGERQECLVLDAMTAEAERTLLLELNRVLAEWDPDIIEGHNLFKFDLDYLRRRCKLLKVPCQWGRFGQNATFRNSRIRIAERWIDFPRCDIPGRTVVDTYLLVQLYDLTKRDLTSYGLKNVALYFGVTDPDKDERSYIEGDQIQKVFVEDRALFLAYLKDDLKETAGIADVLLPTYLAQIQNFPMTLQEATLRGTASKVDSVFLEKYFHARHALPFPPEVQGFEGGYTKSFEIGVFKNVLHFDVASLYPSLLMSMGKNPNNDTLGIFMPMLKSLRQYRLEYKELARTATDTALQQEYHARQASFKILINSFYGYLGFGGARFADSELASEVTARGRELLQTLIDVFQSLDCQVLEADTDGIYLSPSQESTSEDLSDPHKLLQRVSEHLPDGIELELDGHYRSMFCYKAKNYALFDGKHVYIRGSALRSRGIEPFLKELTECLIHRLLGVSDRTPESLLEELREDISHARLPVERLVKREFLSQSPAKYQASIQEGKKNRRASLEVALRQDPVPRMGEAVVYYMTYGERASAPDWQTARPLAEYDPTDAPYDKQHYLKKLDEWKKRYHAFLSTKGQLEQGELF